MVLCPEQEQNDQPFTMQEEPLNRVTGVTVCSVEMAAMNNFLYVVFADMSRVCTTWQTRCTRFASSATATPVSP